MNQKVLAHTAGTQKAPLPRENLTTQLEPTLDAVQNLLNTSRRLQTKPKQLACAHCRQGHPYQTVVGATISATYENGKKCRSHTSYLKRRD